jgi:hypothetical protein
LKRWYGKKERKNYEIVILQLVVRVMAHPNKVLPKNQPNHKREKHKKPRAERKRRKLDSHFKCPWHPLPLFHFFSMELCGVLVLLILILLF